MGIGVGLLIGLAFYAIHRWPPPTASIEIVSYARDSVLHVLRCGVVSFFRRARGSERRPVLSSKRQSMLNFQSRIQGVNVWTNLKMRKNNTHPETPTVAANLP